MRLAIQSFMAMGACVIACCTLASGWTPDSQSWFFFTFAGNEDIYRLDVTEGTITRVTTDPAMDHTPTISADGESFLFTSQRDGGLVQAFRYDLTNGGIEQLTHAVHGVGDANPAPDGQIFYGHQDIDDAYTISVFDMDGSGMRLLVDQDGQQNTPMVSPDGETVVFVNRVGEDAELWLLDVETRQPRQLTRSSMRNEFHPNWFPGSDRVVFVSFEAGRFRVESIAIDGSDRRMHFDDPAFKGFSPQVSPDGRWLAFVRYKEVPEDEDDEPSVVLMPLFEGAEMEVIPVPDYVNPQMQTTASALGTLDAFPALDGQRRSDI